MFHYTVIVKESQIKSKPLSMAILGQICVVAGLFNFTPTLKGPEVGILFYKNHRIL